MRYFSCEKIVVVKGGEGWVRGWIAPFTQLSIWLLDSYDKKVKGEGNFRRILSRKNRVIHMANQKDYPLVFAPVGANFCPSEGKVLPQPGRKAAA